MGTVLILSSLLSLGSAIAMIFALKWGFEEKHELLRLFQFGYTGILFLLFLKHLCQYTQYTAGVLQPETFNQLDFSVDILNSLVIIPYIAYSFSKRRKKIFGSL